MNAFLGFLVFLGVLMALWGRCHAEDKRDAPLSPAELAAHTGVTRATITGLVDTLERDGLVTRTPDPEDRRMMAVMLTPRGEKLLQKVLPSHFQKLTSLLEPLSETERTLAGQGLHCGIVVDGKGNARCVPMASVQLGEQIVTGHTGIRVFPIEGTEKKHDLFEFMTSAVRERFGFVCDTRRHAGRSDIENGKERHAYCPEMAASRPLVRAAT